MSNALPRKPVKADLAHIETWSDACRKPLIETVLMASIVCMCAAENYRKLCWPPLLRAVWAVRLLRPYPRQYLAQTAERATLRMARRRRSSPSYSSRPGRDRSRWR
jgi:hypothetical protein